MNESAGSVTAGCPSCGEPWLADDVFCEACGYQLADPDSASVETEGAPTTVPDHVELDLDGAAAISDRGIVHSTNQDAFALDQHGTTTAIVVCDGVSATVHPERAARAAADTALAHLVGSSPAPTGSNATARREGGMRSAIATAQTAVSTIKGTADAYRGTPSCTLVAAVWDGEMITVGSVGDSRAYWITEDTSHVITVDDSWAQVQVDAGLMTEAEAMKHPSAHAITNWIGRDAPDEPARVVAFRPEAPGRLVVCTDGLWNYAASAAELAALVRAQPNTTPFALADALVTHALRRGGHDNITVAVVDISPRSDFDTHALEEPT